MIINTGGRTDTVHYYTDWLLKRFEEGYVLSRNPLFTNKVSRYELTPEAVGCVVFCSKNYTPILPHIGGIAEKFNSSEFQRHRVKNVSLRSGATFVQEQLELHPSHHISNMVLFHHQ
ncbi:hypothetical protein EDO6_02062 [Paenibacillus xylanexedens]|nr:hypothetical protein EDO6_02062 [Paenibacillus xylanexedens]